MSTQSPEQSAASETSNETDTTLSVRQAAKRIGISEQGLRKAVREKRIRSCTAVSDRPRFTHEEVRRFKTEREKDRKRDEIEGTFDDRPNPKGIARYDREKAALIRAKGEAVTDLVAQALEHTEQGWSEARLMMKEVREHNELSFQTIQNENRRLQARVTELEKHEDENRNTIRILQEAEYNKIIAEAEAKKIKDQSDAFIDTAKLLAPAIVARLIGGEELNQGAFKKIVDSLTDTQRDKVFEALFPIFTEAQRDSFMIMLSGWEGRDSKKKEAARSDTEPPPAATKTEPPAAS